MRTQVRHWAACFDQTYGYPGEGLLTTLDSPDAPGMCLTPTQEIMTCDDQTQNERKTRPVHDMQGVWEIPFTRRHNGLKCRKCLVWARSNACARNVVDFHCCRMTGVAAHESQSQSCSQELGSSAAEGAPRLTQSMEQAMDVKRADVQCDQQHPNERVAYRAALQVVPTTPLAVSIAPIEVETAQPMQLDMAHLGMVRASRSAEAPDLTAAVGWSEEQLWSWRRHCRRCVLSGTSRGASGRGRAQYSRSCCNITRIAITNGPSDVIQSSSRLRLLQLDGPGWAPRCLCGPVRGANKRMEKN